uniref:Putative secreted protein n=1 Tax=Anopheles darlingi TaxID=43151 RepID=A0A2M4D2K1_ANODA
MLLFEGHCWLTRHYSCWLRPIATVNCLVFGLLLIVSSSALPRPPVRTVWYNMYYNTTCPKPYRELLEKVVGGDVSFHYPRWFQW